MLQCPRCASQLTLADCPCPGCSKRTSIPPTINPQHITLSKPPQMGRDLFVGGVIQYPSSAIIKSAADPLFSNDQITAASNLHNYQNTPTHGLPPPPHGLSPSDSSLLPSSLIAVAQNRKNHSPVKQYPNNSPTHGASTAATVDSSTLGGSVFGLHQRAPELVRSSSQSMPCYSGQGTQCLLQQAKQEQQQITSDLLNLQIKVLQNQLQQAKIQQEILTTTDAVINQNPQSSCSSSSMIPLPSSCLSVALSAAPPTTPAILMAANSQPFFPTMQSNTNLLTLNSWCLPSFTPPPDVPLPRQDFSEVWRRSQMELDDCGWYYGKLSWQESSILLQNTEEGTFLVRDSQDSRFLYSLSVQRSKEGPTSVRIQFSGGQFRLDAEEKIRDLMPQFNSVGELIQHYVSLGKKHFRTKEVLIDARVFEERPIHSPIVLRQPRYKSPPSLAHFARLAIHRSIAEQCKDMNGSLPTEQTLSSLKLPAKLKRFLEAYPLSI